MKKIIDTMQKENVIISMNKSYTDDQIINMIKQKPPEKDLLRMTTVIDQQKALNGEGYWCGKPDGSKGPMTRGAIRAFKRLNKLPGSSLSSFGAAEKRKLQELHDNRDREHRTLWFNNCEIHVYKAPIGKVNVTMGRKNKLEKLSSLAKGFVAAINAQFFGGGTDGLGTMIIDGKFYQGPNKTFIDWIHYKDNHIELRHLTREECWIIQRDAKFAIGTSWPLFINGERVKLKWWSISHWKYRHPRTAHMNSEDHMHLMVVDGRNKYSKGATAAQTQNIIGYYEDVYDEKIENAANDDGGGSTEMIVDGKIVNDPSDGRERYIGTAMVVEG